MCVLCLMSCLFSFSVNLCLLLFSFFFYFPCLCFCRSLGWWTGPISEHMHCPPLPALPQPPTLHPASLSSLMPPPVSSCLVLSRHWRSEREEAGTKGMQLGGGCTFRKWKYIFKKKNLLSENGQSAWYPSYSNPPLKKKLVFFNCLEGTHQVVHRETSLDFYLTFFLIWLKRGKPSRCKVGGALWGSV